MRAITVSTFHIQRQSCHNLHLSFSSLLVGLSRDGSGFRSLRGAILQWLIRTVQQVYLQWPCAWRLIFYESPTHYSPGMQGIVWQRNCILPIRLTDTPVNGELLTSMHMGRYQRYHHHMVAADPRLDHSSTL